MHDIDVVRRRNHCTRRNLLETDPPLYSRINQRLFCFWENFFKKYFLFFNREIFFRLTLRPADGLHYLRLPCRLVQRKSRSLFYFFVSVQVLSPAITNVCVSVYLMFRFGHNTRPSAAVSTNQIVSASTWPIRIDHAVASVFDWSVDSFMHCAREHNVFPVCLCISCWSRSHSIVPFLWSQLMLI